MIKLLIAIFCAYLWWEGGGKRAWARDIIIPIIIGISIGFYNHSIFLGLLTIGSMNIIRMGYGAFDPEHDPDPSFFGWLTRDRQGWIIRSIVGAFYILVGGLNIICYQIYYELGFELSKYVGFILISAIINGMLCYLKTKRGIIEPCVGFTTAILMLNL